MTNLSTLGDFQKFVKSASRIIDKISITSGGALGFSTSFSNDHRLEGYSSVVLYWNNQTEEVGIRFVNEEEDGALKLKANNNGKGFTVNAKSFFVTNRIDTQKRHGRFEYSTKPLSEYGVESSENLYIVGLSEKQEEKGEEIIG